MRNKCFENWFPLLWEVNTEINSGRSRIEVHKEEYTVRGPAIQVRGGCSAAMLRYNSAFKDL